jgi:chromosome segregation and condensation protein ScpB
LAELAEATGWPVSEVRLALRRLAEQLGPAGMEVLDDGSHVQLGPEKRFNEAVAHLVEPERPPRLTQEQAEVLVIVIADGMATRRRIEEVRGAATLSIGPDGPVSLPRDSSETLALLLSRGLLCAERDDHATGRPLVYRPTPRLRQLLGAETLEEVRGRMGVSVDYLDNGAGLTLR